MNNQLEVDMSFSEMLKNMFDVSWMSQNEFITICAAAEMYAGGRAKHFVNWVTKEKSPYAVMYDGGEIRFATTDEDLSINQVFEKYKEWRKSQPVEAASKKVDNRCDELKNDDFFSE